MECSGLIFIIGGRNHLMMMMMMLLLAVIITTSLDSTELEIDVILSCVHGLLQH